MKEVILNGFIGDKYGKHWTIHAERPHDVFSCIEANYPSFRKDMIEYIESGGGIDVQCGDRFLEEEDLLFSIPEDSMIITPVPGGAKSGGAKLLLAGLLVASFFIPGSAGLLLSGLGGGGSASAATILAVPGVGAAGIGLGIGGKLVLGLAASLALAGITQMMAPDVKPEGREESNYLFNGPENTVAQNNVVPVLLGEMIVGGVIIASGTVSGLENRSSTFAVTYPTSGVGLDPAVPPPPPPGTPAPGPGGPNDGVSDVTSIPGGESNYAELDS